MMNIDTAKSYATEANLTKALAKTGLDQYRHMVVRTRDGRFTAIFPASEAIRHGYLGVFAQFGFHTIG